MKNAIKLMECSGEDVERIDQMDATLYLKAVIIAINSDRIRGGVEVCDFQTEMINHITKAIVGDYVLAHSGKTIKILRFL